MWSTSKGKTTFLLTCCLDCRNVWYSFPSVWSRWGLLFAVFLVCDLTISHTACHDSICLMILMYVDACTMLLVCFLMYFFRKLYVSDLC